MKLSTTNLVLTPDAAIDLQMHTIYSDGKWQPEQLLDYLVSEQFALAAITDHDRVDIAVSLQKLAIEKKMPLLVATEMTTLWKGGKNAVTDILCYGYDPEKENRALNDLAQAVHRAQQDNTREVYENLQRKGYGKESPPDELTAMLEKPAAQQPNELVAFLERQGCETPLAEKLLFESGYALKTSDTAEVVDAAHRCGAVCLIAHPGRTDGFCTYDEDVLNQFRRDIPIDGLEVYYPRHTPEQVAMFKAYAEKHHLLISSGSDSHDSNKKPIKYRVEQSRALLERLGIQIKNSG